MILFANRNGAAPLRNGERGAIFGLPALVSRKPCFEKTLGSKPSMPHCPKMFICKGMEPFESDPLLEARETPPPADANGTSSGRVPSLSMFGSSNIALSKATSRLPKMVFILLVWLQVCGSFMACLTEAHVVWNYSGVHRCHEWIMQRAGGHTCRLGA